MKLLVTIIAVNLLLINTGIAQIIKDKNQFATNLALIFEQRGNGFDSLRGKEIDGAYQSSIFLQGATECFISNNSVFVADFIYKDSATAVSFYRELKELLNLCASFYHAKVRYNKVYPDDPFFEVFYISDSLIFTNEGSSIQLIADTPEYEKDEEEYDEFDYTNEEEQIIQQGESTYTVNLNIRPGKNVCTYIASAPRINDNELNTFISAVAFGKDTALKTIRTNQRTIQPDIILYDSNIGVKGFKTEIKEIRKKEVSGINVSVSKKYFTDENSFLISADSMIQKLSAALPSTYCFEIFNGMVEFKPIPFLNPSGNEAVIEFRYSQESDQKNEYLIELYIHRKQTISNGG